MTETPCLTVLKYQRSSYTSTAIVFDSDLNLHSVEQLRELARVGVQFNIVGSAVLRPAAHVLGGMRSQSERSTRPRPCRTLSRLPP